MDGTCSTNWDIKDMYEILLGKPQAERPLWRPRLKSKDNIKIHFKEMGCGRWY